jgi:hypothetical protein
VNEGQANSVTAAMIVPEIVSSVDGVSNDAGDIDLIAGSNITITPDDVNNNITIAAVGGGDITGVTAGNGLTGGGSSGSVTLHTGSGDGIDVSADAVMVDVTDFAGNGLGETSNNLKVNTSTGLEISGDAVRLTSSYSSGSAYDSRFVNEGQSNSVTGSMIVNETVGQSDIASDGVAAAEIAANAVGASEIASDSVGRADLATRFKAQYVRVNTDNSYEYIWNDDWYNDSRPDIRTTGTNGQIYIDSHGGVSLRIVIKEDGSVVVNTTAGTYTHTASDGKLLEIYVWPYTFIYQWYVHFTGARERYSATEDHIAGIVRAGTD